MDNIVKGKDGKIMKKRAILCAVTAVVVILAVLFKIISSDSIVDTDYVSKDFGEYIHGDYAITTMKSGEIVNTNCNVDSTEYEGGIYVLNIGIGNSYDSGSKNSYSADNFVLDISFPQDEGVEIIYGYYSDNNRAYAVYGADTGFNQPPSFRFTSDGDKLRANIVFKTKPKEIEATLRYNISGKGFRLLNHFDGQQMELNID